MAHLDQIVAAFPPFLRGPRLAGSSAPRVLDRTRGAGLKNWDPGLATQSPVSGYCVVAERRKLNQWARRRSPKPSSWLSSHQSRR